MSIKRVALIFMMGNSVFAYANSPFSQYLLAATTDSYDVEQDNIEMNIVGSWFEESQVRFKSTAPTNNIDIKKNYLSYELRVEPKAWGQKGLEEDILMLRQQQYQNDRQQLLSFTLQNRYLRLLDYIDQYDTRQYLIELSTALKQEKELIRRQVKSDQFNPQKLFGIEEKLKQVQDEVKLYYARLKKLKSELDLPDTSIAVSQVNSELASVVTIPEILSILADKSDVGSLSPDVSNARLQLQLSQSQNKLTRAKQRLGVNLLKFEYADREYDGVAFQVGLNIPLGASFSDAENKYKQHIAEVELNGNRLKTKHVLDEINREIGRLSDDFDLKKIKIERVYDYLQKDYVKANPSFMVSLYQELVNYKKQKAMINKKTLALYVSYLALSGQLTQQPLRNWIQAGTPELLSSQVH